MAQQALTARGAAYMLLNAVTDEGRTLSEAMSGPRWQALAPEARAAAQRMATETLRWLDRTDRLLKPHLRKAPPLSVRNVLRLASWELATGGAAHGIVNEAVAIVGGNRRTASMKGLVNAVLRKVADEGPAKWNSLPIPRLPRWLRGPLIEAWGNPVVMAMERAHAKGAPLDLSARENPQEVAQRLGGTVLTTGSIRLQDAGQVSALPGYATGDWWVQDAAAALPARLLGDVAGRRVLDMCAAPGGKTLQLAAAGAHVTALDLSEARLGRVRENLARCGLKADVVAGDALTWTSDPFDAILLDAPCSATGTIRRHPDLPHARSGERISELIALQSAMLDQAISLLKPGGVLVFATCSLLPDEGECQVDEVLARHPDLRVDPLSDPWVEDAWRSSEGGLRLRPDFWPEHGGMDGFYMARLRKASPSRDFDA